ncbi:MAG: ferritin [Bacteroidales bacterium]|nr:ferritin [Bacteroidales bacterium]
MISKKMQEAINTQINAEMWSAYLYLAMSMDASDKGFKGVAHWYRKQYEEEMEHAFKFVKYLEEQMARVELKPIDAVQTSWKNVAEMFDQTLAHEKKVTAMINKLYALAEKEKDYATSIMLQWFISEQVEEEANAQELIDTIKCVGTDKAAFFMFDKQLSAR